MVYQTQLHVECLSFSRMRDMALTLGERYKSASLLSILEKYLAHKHTDSCIMQTVNPNEFSELQEPLESCKKLQELHDKIEHKLKSFTDIVEAKAYTENYLSPPEFKIEVVGFSLTETTEKRTHIISKHTPYYSKCEPLDRKAEREYAEESRSHGWFTSLSEMRNEVRCNTTGKPHGEVKEIVQTVKDSYSHMVGRGKKRHREIVTYDKPETVGYEAVFDKEKYKEDKGYGFVQEEEKTLAPTSVNVKFTFKGKNVSGWQTITIPITDNPLENLTTEPLLLGTPKIDMNQLLERAKAIYMAESAKRDLPMIEPEREELIENGHLERAKQEILYEDKIVCTCVTTTN